jgi:hypothetical protein
MTDYLPDVPYISNKFRLGRNIYEGYQRGTFLENGYLRERIGADPDFQDAIGYASDRTLVTPDRLMNLFLLLKFFLPRLPPGDIVEFGSYRGGSAFFLARLAVKFLPETRIFGLDTFAGMPATDPSVDAHSEGQFADSSIEEVLAAKAHHSLGNLEFVKGLFQDTAPALLERAKPLVLTHIDCDIYNAVKYSYLVCKPHMMPMGYYVFDDATAASCIGATEAVEECVIREDGLHAEQIFPHFVFRHPAD